MQNFILSTFALKKVYGRQLAVNDIALRVPEGAIYGLLGPNGAGKTTTLKLITGLLRPSAGEVCIDGRPWQRSHLAQVGALIETPALYGNLSAAENLKVHTLLMGLPDRCIGEVLAQVGLGETPKKRTAQFSLGMKQRLGIGIALLGRPRLLILDEPANGLDPLGIQHLRLLIRTLNKEGISVILSSHILSEVEQLCTHIGIINRGQLCYQAERQAGGDLEALFMHSIQNISSGEEHHG